MSKKLHKYEEQNIDQLTLERNKLEAVLMSIANGVVVCDSFDKIRMLNPAARKILSAQENEIISTSIENYTDLAGEYCFKGKIEEFKNTPLDVIEKNPLEFNVEVDNRVIKSLISPVYSKMHDYLGYIIVLIDITKEAEVDKLKSNFISNVSHELRTPVTVLRSYIDTLYNFGNDFDFNTQREFIGVMNQEIIRLNRMVNDILDFSRYEAQNLHLEKMKQNVIDVIEDAVNQVQVLAKEHDLTISIMKEPDLPEVFMNVDSISRAFMNILSNAIKYSPDGKRIKVRAEIARDPNYVEVTVQDNGIGISSEHQKMIFERF